MPPLMQICAVIVTMAFVAMAIAAIQMMRHFKRSADEISATSAVARASLEKVQGVAREVSEVLDSVKSLTSPLQRVVPLHVARLIACRVPWQCLRSATSS